jgi:hypothetical protein
VQAHRPAHGPLNRNCGAEAPVNGKDTVDSDVLVRGTSWTTDRLCHSSFATSMSCPVTIHQVLDNIIAVLGRNNRVCQIDLGGCLSVKFRIGILYVLDSAAMQAFPGTETSPASAGMDGSQYFPIRSWAGPQRRNHSFLMSHFRSYRNCSFCLALTGTSSIFHIMIFPFRVHLVLP